MNKDNICIHCGGTGRNISGGTCPMCGASVSIGRGKNRREIYVSGSDHNEVLSVAKGLSENNTPHSFFSLLVNWSFIFGVILAILGVILVALGAVGETEFSFFGQTFKSQNIGIASFFLGAVLVVLNVRRILSSYDKKS
ncbi:hypothetical protein [Shewanella seohaensis]|uniref:Uncharacterized protein n=1 Tax=Shewanella seohaensis TaxID=755175 RepID=A0ABV4VZB9_9GAMM